MGVYKRKDILIYENFLYMIYNIKFVSNLGGFNFEKEYFIWNNNSFIHSNY